MYLFNIIISLFLLGFCIFIHEFGHFCVAKLLRYKVRLFSIGIVTIFSFKYNDTEYRIGCLPFGGYVEIPKFNYNFIGNNYNRSDSLKRILIAIAGPFFNIIFGLLLAITIWIHGVESDRLNFIRITSLVKNSPEYNSGLRDGDIILEVNGTKIDYNWNKFVEKIIFTSGDVILKVKSQMNNVEHIIKYKAKINNVFQNIVNSEDLPYPFFKNRISPIYTKKDQYKNLGLHSGGIILEINNIKIDNLIDYKKYLNLNKLKNTFKIKLLMNSKIVELYNIKFNILNDLNGLGLISYKYVNPINQFFQVLNLTYNGIKALFSLNSFVKIKHMTGPIGLVYIISNLLNGKNFIYNIIVIFIMICFAIGIFNLLPIPILDGGHILLSTIEIILNRSLSYNIIKYLFIIFFYIFIGLFFIFSFNDISRIINNFI